MPRPRPITRPCATRRLKRTATRSYGSQPFLSKCGELQSRVMPRFEKWLIGVSASAPVDHVARRALVVRLRAVKHYLDAALSGPDEAEGVHQLRIWTRRAEAALKLFRQAIPGPER